MHWLKYAKIFGNLTAGERREFPKIFWKYYDLYRRRMITLADFSEKSGLPEDEIVYYLKTVGRV